MNLLQRWMASATPQEKLRLARLAKTTVENLRQVAGGYRTKGKLSTTPELARRIEQAMEQNAFRPQGERIILREELCTACRQCDLAKKARSIK